MLIEEAQVAQHTYWAVQNHHAKFSELKYGENNLDWEKLLGKDVIMLHRYHMDPNH